MQCTRIKRPLAAGLLLGLLALPAMAQQIPVQSGLPWPSGVTTPVESFAAWRGRPADVRTIFFGKKTWDHIRATGKTTPGPVPVAIGFPMLPITHAGQLEQCAAGAFDPQIRAVRDTMLAHGWKGSYLRLGWEANRVDHSLLPWAAKGDGASYSLCFRRWVGIMNPGRVKNFYFVWNMANRGTFPYPISRMWPGSDVVDVVASNFYDRCPTSTTDAEWEARLDARDQWGNPAGPRAWLQWAKSKGKRWAMPEWGIGGSRNACRLHGFDNPFFIRKVFEFLQANAADVVFESYFNNEEDTTGTHTIHPMDANPNAAAAYRDLW
jgi:hypothetical protein